MFCKSARFIRARIYRSESNTRVRSDDTWSRVLSRIPYPRYAHIDKKKRIFGDFEILSTWSQARPRTRDPSFSPLVSLQIRVTSSEALYVIGLLALCHPVELHEKFMIESDGRLPQLRVS